MPWPLIWPPHSSKPCSRPYTSLGSAHATSAAAWGFRAEAEPFRQFRLTSRRPSRPVMGRPGDSSWINPRLIHHQPKGGCRMRCRVDFTSAAGGCDAGRWKEPPGQATYEMANLRPERTGLPFVVFISQRAGANHARPRKASQGARVHPHNMGVYAVKPFRHVAGPALRCPRRDRIRTPGRSQRAYAGCILGWRHRIHRGCHRPGD